MLYARTRSTRIYKYKKKSKSLSLHLTCRNSFFLSLSFSLSVFNFLSRVHRFACSFTFFTEQRSNRDHIRSSMSNWTRWRHLHGRGWQTVTVLLSGYSSLHCRYPRILYYVWFNFIVITILSKLIFLLLFFVESFLHIAKPRALRELL